MSLSDLMKAMADAGAPMDAIIIAVRAIEAKDAQLEAKRAIERERKRRQRERDSHGTVTGQSEDSPAQPLSRPPNDIKSNPPTHTPGDISPRTRKGWACPEGVDPQHWTDFLANRKRKRLANTPTAYEGQLREIAKFTNEEWPPGRIVQHAAAQGWGGIYDPKPKDRPRNGNLPSRQPQFGPGEYRDPILGDAFNELHSRMG